MKAIQKVKRFMNTPTPGSDEESYLRRMEQHNNLPVKQRKTAFDKILDWLAQPTFKDVNTPEQAEAANKLTRGYWGATQQKYQEPKEEIHQHLHVYQDKDGKFEKIHEEIKRKQV